MSMKFKDCSVIIYDAYGVPLKSTKVLGYNDAEKYIEVLKDPEFYYGMGCELIILSDPVPYAFSGVMRKNAASYHNMIITLFNGKVKESRTTKRFKLTGEATLTHYIDHKKYDLHTPIKVSLVNISASGIRLIARTNTLSIDDHFNLKLEIAGNDKFLHTKVVNCNNSSMKEGYTEYGCLFIGEDDG